MTTKKKQAALPGVTERPTKPLSVVLREFGERLAKAGQQAALIEAAAATGVGYAQAEQIERVQRWVDAMRENMTTLETHLNAFAYQLNVNRDIAGAQRAAYGTIAAGLRQLIAGNATHEDIVAWCEQIEGEARAGEERGDG